MEYFVKEENMIEINESERNSQLIKSILDTCDNLKKAHINFEFAEEELIDFYSYEIKANQSKLDYLTRLAKSRNLILPSDVFIDSNRAG